MLSTDAAFFLSVETAATETNVFPLSTFLHFTTHQYYWEPRNALGLYDGEDETQSIIPGLGMLANSHTGLVNALMTRPHVNSAGLHRSVDPGAGAFSAYHKYTHLATRHIPAGMELFVECKFFDRFAPTVTSSNFLMTF